VLEPADEDPDTDIPEERPIAKENNIFSHVTCYEMKGVGYLKRRILIKAKTLSSFKLPKQI
jgi:hypothetical protein